MAKLSVDQIDVQGKRVLLRCDFNVPLDRSLRITDHTRISDRLPTLQPLRGTGPRVLIAAPLGRPDAKPTREASLRSVAVRLAELLGKGVPLAPDCVGPEVRKMVDQ